jgi:thiol-disulfide isomerase/thioredoxin
MPAPASTLVQEPAAQLVEYTFQEAPVHAEGVRSLADLRGKPVLIGFWGTHETKCVEETVPAFLALQNKHEDDLQVVFVEIQGADPKAAEAFAWRHTWMGAGAMWTGEPPLHVEGDALPRFALLGCHGELLLSGDPSAQEQQIELAIAEQIKRSREAPPGTSKVLSKAWKSFLAGKVCAGLTECDERAADDASAAPLRAEMVARTESRIARCRWLLDNGHVDDAMARLLALGEEVDGCAEFVDPVAEQLTRLLLRDEDLSAEAEACKALTDVESKMSKGNPFARAQIEELERIRQQHPSTRAAQRAARLIELAKLGS